MRDDAEGVHYVLEPPFGGAVITNSGFDAECRSLKFINAKRLRRVAGRKCR